MLEKEIQKLINDKVIESVMESVDFSQYKKDLEKAIKNYLTSEDFTEVLHEYLYEAGIGYVFAEHIEKQLKPQLKKLKVDISF